MGGRGGARERDGQKGALRLETGALALHDEEIGEQGLGAKQAVSESLDGTEMDHVGDWQVIAPREGTLGEFSRALGRIGQGFLAQGEISLGKIEAGSKSAEKLKRGDTGARFEMRDVARATEGVGELALA